MRSNVDLLSSATSSGSGGVMAVDHFVGRLASLLAICKVLRASPLVDAPLAAAAALRRAQLQAFLETVLPPPLIAALRKATTASTPKIVGALGSTADVAAAAATAAPASLAHLMMGSSTGSAVSTGSTSGNGPVIVRCNFSGLCLRVAASAVAAAGVATPLVAADFAPSLQSPLSQRGVADGTPMTKPVPAAAQRTQSSEATTRAIKGRHSYSLQVLPSSSAAASVHLAFTNSAEHIPASSTPPPAAAAVALTVDEWQRIAAAAATATAGEMAEEGEVGVTFEQAAPLEGVDVWTPLWRLWLRLSAAVAA
jgi:hypothetical protein